MKALTRILVNPSSKNLEKIESEFDASARKVRALGKTSMLMNFDRIHPLFLGASNSFCTEERIQLTQKGIASVVEIATNLQRSAEEPGKDHQTQI
ncbi:MAG: hypothetical protein O9327_18300 [Polaromonas sp.]|nr:hypothetical protein [Polaromonas sp.]